MNESMLAHPPLVDRETWRRERKRLLQQEKAVTRLSDAVNAKRRRLPMVRLDRDYRFEGESGGCGLLDLFEGRRQLIVYHFMFDPAWEKGCHGCTGWVDAIGDLSMLAARQTSMVLISRAPYEKLKAYREKRGWTLPWYSSFASDFNYDFHATLDADKAPPELNYRGLDELAPNVRGRAKGEIPGLSVFFRGDDNTVFHSYSSYARGCEYLTDAYRLLDVTPYGRQEDWEDSPPGWPQKPTYG
ncbi:DUF899 domain-containing protein [Solimonas marina]|uniref:DUF899 domain-containing protein n=1 Tax=Solimonas marina TaxID=2714601 RepID=A0A969WDH1_9GAMM|nr:DUF899 domain-containing protein [Solimonas marina]NKF22785.1 DUF899 domain-containing protein [Solimonas marina]